MKKKLLSLSLCLVLCLSMALTSCSLFKKDKKDPEPPAPPSFSTYELLGGKFEPEENYTSHTTTKIVGETSSRNGVLLTTTKSEISDDENEVTTTYRVYNLEKGTVVFSASTTYSYYSFEYTSSFDSITITLKNSYFVVEKSKDEDTTIEVYSQNGSILLSKDEEITVTSVSLDFIEEPTFVFDNGLYKIEASETGDKATLIKELEFATLLDDDVQIVKLQSGNYLAVVYDYYSNETEEIVYILDGNFNFIRAIELYNKEFLPMGSDNVSEYLFLLNNGNLALQLTTKVGSYYDVCSSGVEYDYALNSNCYTVDTYIYNTSTGEKTVVDTPYVFEYVISRFGLEQYESSNGIPFDFENISAYTCKIENKCLVPVSSSPLAYTVLDNDLNVINTYETLPLGYKNASIISEGKYVLSTDFSTELYNADGTLIKNIGDADTNEKYVISSKAIYDHNMNLVYSLEDSELKISRICADCIIFYEQDEETGNYLYYRLNGTSTEPQLFLTKDSDTQIYWKDNYYYTTVHTPAEVEGEDGTVTLSVYAYNGTLITTMTVSDFALISASSASGTNYYYDYISISDENEVTIIVLK